MPFKKKKNQDAVTNLSTLQEISQQLGFEWTVLASELGFSRAEIHQFHTKSTERNEQARLMLERWYFMCGVGVGVCLRIQVSELDLFERRKKQPILMSQYFLHQIYFVSLDPVWDKNIRKFCNSLKSNIFLILD